MRFSAVAIVASVLAVASALDYPFQPNGACVQGCLDTIGKKMYPDYTTDPNNPHFIESLSYAHDRGTPKYTAYMTETGMCLTKCPRPELDFYNEQYDAKNDWYQANKNGGTAASGSAAPPAASGSAAPPAASGSGSTPSTTGSSPKPSNAASNIAASAGVIGAAAVGAAALLF